MEPIRRLILVFVVYLTPYCHTLMPPTAPDPVVPNYTPSAPTAPGNAAGSGAVGAPSAPVAIQAGGQPSAPSAPGNAAGSGAVGAPSAPVAVLGPATPAALIIGGTITPADLIGVTLVTVASPALPYVLLGERQWSSNGNTVQPGGGGVLWTTVRTNGLVTPAAATINEIVPVGNYVDPDTTAGSWTDGSYFSVTDPGGAFQQYNCYTVGGVKRWISNEYIPELGDLSDADMGGTVVPAGSVIYCIPGPNGTTGGATAAFLGGLGQTWQEDSGVLRQYAIHPYSNNNYSTRGYWIGRGVSPLSATWVHMSVYGSGTPVITGAVSAPDAVQAGGQPSAPSAPGNATGSGSVSAPSAPVAVQAGGQPSAPTAPGNAAGSGSISAPTAPDAIQSGGQPSAPSVPGNAAGSGSVSAPSAPVAIQSGGQPSAPTAPGNAAGSGSVGAPSAPAAVQAGGQPAAPAAPSPVQP